MTTNIDELDRGWTWIVLFSSFCYFMIFGMFLYGVGMVHAVLLEEFGGKSASTAWAGGLYAALVSLCGPVSSLIIDKVSCRVAMFIDGILTTVGCLATAFSPSLPLSIFTYGFVAGLGGGIGYTATMVVVGFNFQRWRNIALSIAISGVGFGACILTPVMEVIKDFYGNAGFFIILAAIGLHKCVFAVLCKPSKMELLHQESLRNEKSEEALTQRQVFQHYAKVCSNKMIICFSLCLMLFSTGTYMIFLHLPAFATVKGYSGISATLLISSCGISTIAARIFITLITEKTNADDVILYSLSFGSLAFGTFLFPLYCRTFAGLLIYSVLLGAYFGGCYAVMNSINIRIVGIKFLSIATGMELLFCAIGMALGPVITGAIVDRGGTYEHAFIISAFLILLGAALGMATMLFQTKEDHSNNPDVDIIIRNHGDAISEGALSTNVNGHHNHEQVVSSEIEEKQDSECQEFSAEQKSSCYGIACAAIVIENTRTQSNSACDTELTDFTEEIEKLLNGEELEYIDES